MESLLIILVVILIALNVGVIFFLIKKKPENEEKSDQVLKQEISAIRNSFTPIFWLNVKRDIAKDP
jgi:hypothetical protein